MCQDGVGQRACGIARARMHHHPCRLVDGDDIIILVNNCECDVLGLCAHVGGRSIGDIHDHHIAGFNLMAGGSHHAIHCHMSQIDQALNCAAACVRKQTG